MLLVSRIKQILRLVMEEPLLQLTLVHLAISLERLAALTTIEILESILRDVFTQLILALLLTTRQLCSILILNCFVIVDVHGVLCCWMMVVVLPRY